VYHAKRAMAARVKTRSDLLAGEDEQCYRQVKIGIEERDGVCKHEDAGADKEAGSGLWHYSDLPLGCASGVSKAFRQSITRLGHEAFCNNAIV
jgi:hypothetical protein